MSTLIKLHDVYKIYPLGGIDVPAINGISLEIKKGDFVALIGPSGSGKSTAMNLVGCLDTATKGDIFLGTHNINHLSESDLAQIRGKQIGFIFQTFNLIPSLSALDNVALPMMFQDVSQSKRQSKAKQLLEQVGLADRMYHLPNQLSGGQRQRVAIARALVNDPEIILADEPTGNLDTKTGDEIMKILQNLHTKGKTIILVTHNPELTKLANKIIKLKDGKVVKSTEFSNQSKTSRLKHPTANKLMENSGTQKELTRKERVSNKPIKRGGRFLFREMKSLLMIFMMLMLILPLASAQITIDTFTATPEKVEPGSDVVIELSIENAGNDDIENVIVRLDLSQVPFAPVGSSTERAVDEIRDHRHETMQFTLRALPDAQTKTYKIPVIITHGITSTTSLIGIEVSASAHLDILVDNTELVQVGDKGKVIFKFINDGLTQIQLLKVTLRESPGYEIVSSRSLYVGEVDVGDFETEEFVIIPTMANPVLALDLEYKDTNNREFSATQLIQLNVYTAQEAQQLGLVNNGKSMLYLVLGIIVLVIIFIIYKKRRKHNNAP